MAAVRRLIVAALLLVAGHAHALVPTITGKIWWSTPQTQAQGVFGDLEAGCRGWIAFWNSYYGTATRSYAGISGAGTCHYSDGGSYTRSLSSVNATQCPANSTAVTGGCQCNSGFQEDGTHTACEPIPTANEKWKQWCENASSMPPWFVELPGRGAKSGCQNLTLAGSPIDTPGYVGGEVPLDAGCKIALDNAKSFPDADGNWYTQGDARVTGGTCRESDPTEGDPEGTEKQPAAKDPPCVGGYAGEVNGTAVCAKPDPTRGVDWAGTQQTTNPDGSSTTTGTDTKCTGSTCTTTTTQTTRDSAGNVTGTSTTSTTESHGSLCARDKGNGVCSGGGGGGDGDGESSFGGNCESGFQAKSDDAVLNAIALEQHKRNCTFFGDPDGEPQDIPKQTKTATLGTVTVGGWGNSCPPPMTFTFWGETYELSFRGLCESAPMVRPWVLLICGLLSMYIVYSALRGSQ